MSSIIRTTIRVNPADTFSLEGDKTLFDQIVADQEKHAGLLRPTKIWDLEIGGHDGRKYFHSQQRGETLELDAYSDDRYYENFSSLQKMLEPFVGSAGLQPINKDVVQKYYSYLKGIDHLGILSNYLEPDGEMKHMAEGLLITDLGSIIDVNIISSFLHPAAETYRVLEVGGGYGRLAEAFLNMYGKSMKYVLLDAVPASLMYSYLYLSKSFPDLRIGFYYKEDTFDLDLFDCYIMPAWHFDSAAHAGSFDCCLNVQSMQEMNQYHIDYYLNLFNTVLKEGSGIAYISNEKDYLFQGDWNYPKNWRLLLKTRSPRSWTRNSPTEVFLKSAGSFEKENQLVDFIYSLQLKEFDRNAEQLKTISGLQLEQTKSQKQISSLQEQLSSLQSELRQARQQISSLQLDLQTNRQEISRLQLELQKSQQQASQLSSTLMRMPLAEEEPTVERAEQSLQALNEHYRSEAVPQIARLFEPLSKITTHLVLANLYLRRGRYRTAFAHLIQIGKRDPLSLLSLQTIRVLVDGLVFRLKESQRR